jgi:hypothetical protein
MFKLFSVRMFVAAMLLGGTLFAQHYQGRDHTVFHPAAPAPAKHATTAPGTTPSGARTSDSAKRHDVTYSSSTTPHTPQPPQSSPRPK